MRVGVQLFASLRDPAVGSEPLHETVKLAVLAEELGFDTVWLAEHHRTPWNICPDPLTLLAHIAAVTSRIRLGTAIVNLTLHQPVELAERILMVDALSGGRLELGIGRGFAPDDYALYGVDSEEAGSVFNRHHQALIEALDQARSGLLPTPAQPEPPMWLSTTGSEKSLSLATEHRYGLLMAGTTDKITKSRDHFASRWQARQRTQPRIGVARAIHVADTEAQARAELAKPLAWYISRLHELLPTSEPPPVEDVMATFCVLGAPHSCLESLRQLRDKTGMTDLIGVFGIGLSPGDKTGRAMRRFAADVLPKLRELSRSQDRISPGGKGGR